MFYYFNNSDSEFLSSLELPHEPCQNKGTLLLVKGNHSYHCLTGEANSESYVGSQEKGCKHWANLAAVPSAGAGAPPDDVLINK